MEEEIPVAAVAVEDGNINKGPTKIRSTKTSQIFLSHDHRDQVIATILAETLSEISQKEIKVWYSSDASLEGGISPGKVWLDEIRLQIQSSQAILVLLTPGSMERPWLAFETGYAVATPGCNVVPVCVGISKNKVPFPLGMFQCYQLGDYESLKKLLCAFLLQQQFQIHFDEESVKPILQQAIKRITRAMGAPEGDKHPPSEFSQVLQHMKKQEEQLQVLHRRLDQALDDSEQQDKPTFSPYSVEFQICFPDFHRKIYLEMDHDRSVENVLDNVYTVLDDRVDAQRRQHRVCAQEYLQTWVIRNATTGQRVVVWEVADLVPAYHIFSEGSTWLVLPLYVAYTIDDSDQWMWERAGAVRRFQKTLGEGLP